LLARVTDSDGRRAGSVGASEPYGERLSRARWGTFLRIRGVQRRPGRNAFLSARARS